jgi:geranylgeranyl pyrophosphate synthase
MLYAALHILDDIEDGDAGDAFGPHSAASQMLNASTGLLLSATLILDELREREVPGATIAALKADLQRTVLGMCGGQHDDLTQDETSLERAWQIAELKSGAFFSLGCRMGARLGTDDPRRLDAYARYGHHLGMLIQIGDDWGDLRPKKGKSDLARGLWASLPVAYAQSVLPPAARARLRACLQAAQEPQPAQEPPPAQWPRGAEAEARELIEGAGAELYLATQSVLHGEQAADALERACPPCSARDELAKLLDRMAVVP